MYRRSMRAKIGASGSMRQQMEEHRANPMCASCHSKMDPLGFAFENFNAIGAVAYAGWQVPH